MYECIECIECVECVYLLYTLFKMSSGKGSGGRHLPVQDLFDLLCAFCRKLIAKRCRTDVPDFFLSVIEHRRNRVVDRVAAKTAAVFDRHEGALPVL